MSCSSMSSRGQGIRAPGPGWCCTIRTHHADIACSLLAACLLVVCAPRPIPAWSAAKCERGARTSEGLVPERRWRRERLLEEGWSAGVCSPTPGTGCTETGHRHHRYGRISVARLAQNEQAHRTRCSSWP